MATPDINSLTPPLFSGVAISKIPEALMADPVVAQYEAELAGDAQLIRQLLPIPVITLTAGQADLIDRVQNARDILDSAALAPMECEPACHFINSCPLAKMGKHPVGEKCPFETQYVVARFVDWMRELGRTEATLLMSERVNIGILVGLQVELLRCRAILAQAEHAHLTQRSVKDVDANTGMAIAWEDQVHILAQREDSIITEMRMILRDFELTPEMKTKRQKALNLRDENDLATKQSSIYDKLRQHKKAAAPACIDIDLNND